MSLYSDISTSIGQGFSRTAEDYYTQAKQKFLDRVANRKPKTALEKNIGDSYANTESGINARNDYITEKLRGFFAVKSNLYLTIGVVTILAFLIIRRR